MINRNPDNLWADEMTVNNDQDVSQEHVIIDTRGALGRIELNRPQALNALTTNMRAQIAASIPGFARDPMIYALIIKSRIPRAFSVGGDIREISVWGRERPTDAQRSLREEYSLNWLLECFSKPTISFINGMVMGSGVGISIYGTHRIAGERYSFAMPETAIGLFPDDGVASVFARLPDHIGLYLGLTGRRIGPADAFRLGLVTHCIPEVRFAEIEEALASADPVDPLLDSRHEDPDPGELDNRITRSLIAECFSAPSVEAIIAALERASPRSPAARGWCEGVIADLRQRSPTSLKVTFRHIQDAVARDLRQTLMVDYRLASRFLAAPDFHEGVRATLIDKGQSPKWHPERLEDVSEAAVERYFAPIPGGELILPTRQEMQSARV